MRQHLKAGMPRVCCAQSIRWTPPWLTRSLEASISLWTSVSLAAAGS
jgi:hypothetical protein